MKKSTAAIKLAFDQLSGIFASRSTNYAERLLDECVREEKGHRGVLPEFNRYHTSDTIGIRDAAKLFAVKRVAEYILGGWTKYPTGKDYLHTQTSCFIAAGIADEFKLEIQGDANGNGGIWTPDFLKWLSELDYSDYVKVNKAA